MFKFFLKIMIFIHIILPSFSHAQIIISEIMYDAEGSDTNNEWIELYNNGSSSVNLNNYHFFEAGVHHGLNSENNISLAPGEYAIITQNLNQFISRYGSFENILKSSFSLNNSGEELALSDDFKNIIYSITYDNSFGANGNGNSLSYDGNKWFESSPSPGREANNNVIEFGDAPKENTQKQKESIKSDSALSRNKNINYYEGFIDVPVFGIANSNISINAYAIHHKGSQSTKKLKGVYYLNFGDGESIESNERFELIHQYQYPGTYSLVLEYYSSKLSKNSNKEPDVLTKKNITIHDPGISIIDVNSSNGIVLMNNMDLDIDLNNWNISVGETIFSFPKYSFIASNTEKIIPYTNHNINPINYNDWVVLRNENNRTISSYIKNPLKLKNIENTTILNTPDIITNLPLVSTNSEIEGFLETENKEILDFNEQYLLQHPDKIQAVFNSPSINENNRNKSINIPVHIIIILAIVSLILIALRAYQNTEKNEFKKDDDVIGDIELL